MEALSKVKFEQFDRIGELNGHENKSIEQVLTEAILYIQRNTKHKIIHQEISYNQVTKGILDKKVPIMNVDLKLTVQVLIE